jgi:hypothetical protein
MNAQPIDFDCCPPFDPAPWDDKVLHWDNKLFVKARVFTLFYVPINFGATMKRLNACVEEALATIPDWLCLSDHTSKWNMDLFLAVDKEIPTLENVRLSGNYYCRVYEGNYNETGKWMVDFEKHCEGNAYQIKKMYMWYTTCPKCAKKYGKNFTVILSKI